MHGLNKSILVAANVICICSTTTFAGWLNEAIGKKPDLQIESIKIIPSIPTPNDPIKVEVVTVSSHSG